MNNSDEINELIILVRLLLQKVNTLELAVGELDIKVQKINTLSGLLDTNIESLLFGEVLQYSQDGKWHNIDPSKIAIKGESIAGVFKLSDLEDVAISSPSNDQILTYSTLDRKWHNNNNTSGGGGGGLDPNVYLTKTDAKSTYFPLTGGTINGNVKIKGNLQTTGGITLYDNTIK